MALINLNREDWWFDMKTRNDRIEMSLYVTRYVSTLFIFVLALRAPGITNASNEDEDVLVENDNQNVSIQQRLAFSQEVKKKFFDLFSGKSINI